MESTSRKESSSPLASDDIYAEIEKLKPTHRMYLALKQELARYRQAAAGTERVTIAQGKSIEPDTHDERVLALRTRLSISGDLDAAQDVVIRSLRRRRCRPRYSGSRNAWDSPADGKIGARTITELNVPLDERIRQLRVNLDRGRVLLHDLPHEFVVVNIAAYWVYLVRGQEIVWNARAQVGKTYRRTPMFRSDIDYLVLNPTWTVPPGIIRNDILPDARRDPASITRRGLNVLDAQGNDGRSRERRLVEVQERAYSLHAAAGSGTQERARAASRSCFRIRTPCICTTRRRSRSSKSPIVPSARAACGSNVRSSSRNCCWRTLPRGTPRSIEQAIDARPDAERDACQTRCRCCSRTGPPGWIRRDG